MTGRWLGLIGTALLLVACGGNTAATQPTAANPIEWDRSPNSIVFRADVVGGSSDDSLVARNTVPACTIYGDNRVVWVNEVGPFNVQVLWDRLSDDQIRNFVMYLTINERYFDYQAKAALEPPSGTSPVVETLALTINNDPRVTDAFSGWDPDYYQRIVQSCKNISRAPILFEPNGGWVSAQVVEYDPNAPGVPWDGKASGLVLADLSASGQPRWITDRNVPILWNLIRTSPPNIQFYEDGVQYAVALEVPNVTRSAQPPPS